MINLSEFHSYVADKQPNICQVTVIQNDKTIINDIWNGYKANDTVHTMSVTKSIVSLLVGIAIEQRLIGSIYFHLRHLMQYDDRNHFFF